MARGELAASTDVELVNDALGGMIYWRMLITSGKVDPEYLEHLTDFVIAAIGVDRP